MNKQHYRELKEPFLKCSKELHYWVVGSNYDSSQFPRTDYGPKVLIIGSAP